MATQSRRKTRGRALTPAEADRLNYGAPQALRAVHYVAEQRLLLGAFPSPGSVWGVFWYGDPDRTPHPGQRVDRLQVSRNGRARWVSRPEPADVMPTLAMLYQYGIRWERDPDSRFRPRMVHLVGPVYRQVLPDVRANLTERGLYPPRDPGGKVINYRGRRAWTRQPRGWEPQL